MARVEIFKSLVEEIKRKFNKAEANDILDLMQTLEENPKKGKPLGNVGGILISEIRYKGFRFYFLADGHKLKFCRQEDLSELLIRFVRMSDKKQQQETIAEIRLILLKIGVQGFQ
jgi:hypothetical protein